jgi:hypothetical protein
VPIVDTPVAEPFPFERPIPPRLREIYDSFGAGIR